MPSGAARAKVPRPPFRQRFAGHRGRVRTMLRVRFRLTGAFIALNDLLKVAGVCASGGAGKALVATGQVRVDGRIELRKTCKIRAGQAIRVGDTEIRVLAPDRTP
jgi:ribosome-associated protein